MTKEELKLEIEKLANTKLKDFQPDEATEKKYMELKLEMLLEQCTDRDAKFKEKLSALNKDFETKWHDREKLFEARIKTEVYKDEMLVGLIDQLKEYSDYTQSAGNVIADLQMEVGKLNIKLQQKNSANNYLMDVMSSGVFSKKKVTVEELRSVEKLIIDAMALLTADENVSIN